MPTPQQVAAWRGTAAWQRTRLAVRMANPICQRLDDVTGEQCRYPATMIHHLVAPEVAWELRHDWSNLVAVCREHHPRTTGDDGEHNYTPTHEVVRTAGIDRWHHHAHVQTAIVPTGNKGKQGTTTAVGAGNIDKALEGIESLNLDDF